MTKIHRLLTWRSAMAESDLPSTEKLVAFALSLFMSEGGDSCWPSHDTLAKRTSLHPRTVRGSIYALEAKGWLTKTVTRRGFSRGSKVFYTASLPTTTVAESTSTLDHSEDIHSGGDSDHCGARSTTTVAQSTSENSSMNSTETSSADFTSSLHFELLQALRSEGTVSLSTADLAITAEAMNSLEIPPTREAILDVLLDALADRSTVKS